MPASYFQAQVGFIGDCLSVPVASAGLFGRGPLKGAFELTGKGLGSMLGAQFALTSSTLDLQKTN